LLVEYPTSSFRQAISLSERELVAFVGGGGKTIALQCLTEKLFCAKLDNAIRIAACNAGINTLPKVTS